MRYTYRILEDKIYCTLQDEVNILLTYSRYLIGTSPARCSILLVKLLEQKILARQSVCYSVKPVK